MVFNDNAERLSEFSLVEFAGCLFDICIEKFPKPGLKLKELFF
jgi:hypothetical protein